jgi:Domain of unknown function (DUF5658)
MNVPIVNWTNGQTAKLAVLTLTAILTILADGYTTTVALAHGFKEGNPIMRWLFGKVGQALAIFISVSLVLFAGGLISGLGLNYGYLYFGIVSAGEAVRALLNYRTLKAAKISLK